MAHQFSDKRNKEAEKRHLRIAVFDEPAILVNLGQLYQPNIGEAALYEITRSLAKVGGKRAKRTKLVCAVYQGFIKEVYAVSKWKRSHFWSSFCFEGAAGSDKLREKYINHSVAAYWGWADRAPVKYASYTANGKKHKS